MSRPKIVNYCQPGVQAPRRSIPKDGPGPRGLPDCYYISRTLNSTFRYARFVKRLRATEEEQRVGEANKLIQLKDRQTSDFFIRCDRRSLINNVSRRVDLCLQSYEQDLEQKRKKLVELFANEEKENISKFVVQAQAGSDLIWEDKMKRLKYLIDKRQKEHADKYKEPPISKAVHVHPCIQIIREKEGQDILKYQMKEKQARKMAEIETDKLWHQVTMKEAEALAARMEQDAMDRYRRDMECKYYTDLQLQQKKEQREKERERLKREQLMLMSIWEEDNKNEEEKIQLANEKKKEIAEERKAMLQERRELEAQRAFDDKQIDDTWASLSNQGLADDKAHMELRKRRERELDICNAHLMDMRKDRHIQEAEDEKVVKAEMMRQQDVIDKRRCAYQLWSKKTNVECRQGMLDQMQEHKDAREREKEKLNKEDEYQKQLTTQMDQLVELRLKQTNNRDYLKQQMEYNKLLKERAVQEEKEQLEKYKKATEDYKDEIAKMLCRPFFSEDIHPFMKQMACKKLEMKPKCPCSKPDHCK